MKIAVGGFQHETNTFAGVTTSRSDFDEPGGWPRFSRGAEVVAVLADAGAPTAGALAEAASRGIDVVPLLWCIALPSGPVEDDAFEDIAGELVKRFGEALAEGGLDGLYLDLHGAMATQSHPDAEGELLRRLRAIAPEPFPIVASLDFHANLSESMVADATLLDCYRTYPHVDMRETGARAFGRLVDMIEGAYRPAKAVRPIPFFMGMNDQCTLVEPAKRLVALGNALETDGRVLAVAQCFGFGLADIPDVGPTVVAYDKDPKMAEAAADAMAEAWIAAEPEFVGAVLGMREAVSRAMALAEGPGTGPVVIADTQDNPGGGGPGDTTGLLQTLIDAGADGAVVVHIADAAACKAAHAAGIGATIDIAVGGGTFPELGPPVPGPFTVAALGDGSFTGIGPMYRGNAIKLGPVALLERSGVRVIVAPRKMQASEPALLHHLGLEPKDLPILVVKSSVHFRGAYQTMAKAIVIAKAPGVVGIELNDLTFRHAWRRIAQTTPSPR